MTTVHSVQNIKDIAILAYNGNVSYVPADIFIDCINLGGGIDRDMGNGDQKCDEWDTEPQSAYKITNHDRLSSNSSGSRFNKGDGAAHDNDKKYYDCTKYWNLFSDDRMTIEKQNLYNNKFKRFNDDNNARENWIGNDEDGRKSGGPAGKRYRLFWRVYYRTIDDYFNLNKCGQDNLELNSYNNNKNCKDYIQNNKWSYLSNACLKLSDDQLFSEACNDAVNRDDNNKERIMKKRMEYCKDNRRIIDNQNCKIFLNQRPDKLAQRDKEALDTWVVNTFCGSGSNPNDKTFIQPNKEFCACVNEIRPEKRVEYRDANDLNGSIKTISGVCNTDDCQNNNKAYKQFGHDSAVGGCPKNICIQNQEMKNLISAKNISQNCNIQSDTGNSVSINNNPSKTSVEPPKTSVEPPKTSVEPPKDIPKQQTDESLTQTISKEIDNLLPGVFPIQITESFKFNQIHFLILIISIIFLLLYSMSSNSNNTQQTIYYQQPEYYSYPQQYY